MKNAIRYRMKVSGASSTSGDHTLVSGASSLSRDRILASGTNPVSDDHTLVGVPLSHDRILAIKFSSLG
jgi:hypothetical protein